MSLSSTAPRLLRASLPQLATAPHLSMPRLITSSIALSPPRLIISSIALSLPRLIIQYSSAI
nr:hypothetical protein [uncultured Porphyromonas sp.]